MSGMAQFRQNFARSGLSSPQFGQTATAEVYGAPSLSGRGPRSLRRPDVDRSDRGVSVEVLRGAEARHDAHSVAQEMGRPHAVERLPPASPVVVSAWLVRKYVLIMDLVPWSPGVPPGAP
jgi:hypothetical protein